MRASRRIACNSFYSNLLTYDGRHLYSRRATASTGPPSSRSSTCHHQRRKWNHNLSPAAHERPLGDSLPVRRRCSRPRIGLTPTFPIADDVSPDVDRSAAAVRRMICSPLHASDASISIPLRWSRRVPAFACPSCRTASPPPPSPLYRKNRN